LNSGRRSIKTNRGYATIATALALSVALGCWGVSEPTFDDAWGTSQDVVPVWPGSLALDVAYDTLRNPTGTKYLQATVRATNVGHIGISAVTSRWCWGEWRAFVNPDRTGEPVWSSPDWVDYGCDNMAWTADLPPGGTASWDPGAVLNIDELVREHGAGTYYFLLRIVFSRPNVRTGPLPAGEVYLGP
jgi:hypothetical protein